MPSTETVRRQHALGGAAGVVLLGFALVYRFYPDLLHLRPGAPPQERVDVTGSAATPMGFERRPTESAPQVSERDAGPPISLAPAAVIGQRHAAAVAGAVPEAATTPEIAKLLERARKAYQAGRLVGPGEDTVLALYADVLKLDPRNRQAKVGLVELRARLMAEGEQALAAGDADAAGDVLAALKQVPESDADAVQLDQRIKAQQQVRPLLTQAADLLKQGKAMAPAGGSALDLYRKTLAADPQNAVAQQGLQQIQRSVLDQALAAVAQDNFAGADAALAQAAAILPGSQALQDTRGRVEGIRRQRAESVLAQARSALDAGNPALAQQLARQALDISPDVPGVDEFNERLRNARLYASYRPGQVFADRFMDTAGQGPSMVVVPTGSFLMGSPDGEPGHRTSEGPQHQVDVANGFALGRTEVTVAQFRDFVRATGYATTAERLGGSSVYDESSGTMRESRRATWRDDYAGERARDNDPVVNVSWDDAQAYVQWLSQRTGKHYRLPSEAEFEYALRAGSATRYWWGDGAPSRPVENVTGAGDRSPMHRLWSNAFPNYRDGYWGPAPVMSFAANAFGLYDMDGNVSEWVEDCWHDNYTRAPRDDSAWVNPGCERRVVRGGSWGSDPDQVRSAFRLSASAETRSGRVGFRVARDL